MFIENRYTKLYYNIINKALIENRSKNINNNLQLHHIIPKSIGGSDNAENLVLLTYKEHRVCHCLLIKMQLNFHNEIKMRHAYGFFNKKSSFNGPRYKKGKENIFASNQIKKLVKERMIKNNPMKDSKQKERMRNKNNNPFSKPIITPKGEFPSRSAAIRAHNFKHWKILADLIKMQPELYYFKNK